MSLRRDVEVRNKLSMKEGQEGRTKYGTWEDNLISRVRQLSRHSEALLLYPYAAVELQMLTDEEKKSLDKFRYETRKELRVAMIKKMTTAPTTISSPSDDEEESASPSPAYGSHASASRSSTSTSKKAKGASKTKGDHTTKSSSSSSSGSGDEKTPTASKLALDARVEQAVLDTYEFSEHEKTTAIEKLEEERKKVMQDILAHIDEGARRFLGDIVCPYEAVQKFRSKFKVRSQLECAYLVMDLLRLVYDQNAPERFFLAIDSLSRQYEQGMRREWEQKIAQGAAAPLGWERDCIFPDAIKVAQALKAIGEVDTSFSDHINLSKREVTYVELRAELGEFLKITSMRAAQSASSQQAHMVTARPGKKPKINKQQTPGSGGAKPKQERECFACGKKGHFARDCDQECKREECASLNTKHLARNCWQNPCRNGACKGKGAHKVLDCPNRKKKTQSANLAVMKRAVYDVEQQGGSLTITLAGDLSPPPPPPSPPPPPPPLTHTPPQAHSGVLRRLVNVFRPKTMFGGVRIGEASNPGPGGWMKSSTAVVAGAVSQEESAAEEIPPKPPDPGGLVAETLGTSLPDHYELPGSDLCKSTVKILNEQYQAMMAGGKDKNKQNMSRIHLSGQQIDAVTTQDSACTLNVVGEKRMLSDIKRIEPFSLDTVGGKEQVADKGTLTMVFSQTQRQSLIVVDKEAIVKKSVGKGRVLVSLARMLKLTKADGVWLDKRKIQIMKDNKVLLEGAATDNGLWTIHCKVVLPNGNRTEATAMFANSPKTVDAALFHRRMGHADYRYLEVVAKRSGITLSKLSEAKSKLCEGCTVGASQRKGTRKKNRMPVAEKKGEGAHVDLVDMIEKSRQGCRYALTFTDSKIKLKKSYYLKTKDEQIRFMRIYVAWSHTQTGNRLKWVRLDGESSWTSGLMREITDQQGMELFMTTRNHPSNNAVAERTHATTVNRLSKTMNSRKTLKGKWSLWQDIHAAIELMDNHTPTKGVEGDKAPVELWDRVRRYDASFFRELGCICYVHIDKDKRKNKVSPRAARGVFIGYDNMRRAYRVLLDGSRKIVSSVDVDFDESPESDGVSDDAFAQSQGIQVVPADEYHNPAQNPEAEVDQEDFVSKEAKVEVVEDGSGVYHSVDGVAADGKYSALPQTRLPATAAAEHLGDDSLPRSAVGPIELSSDSEEEYREEEFQEESDEKESVDAEEVPERSPAEGADVYPEGAEAISTPTRPKRATRAPRKVDDTPPPFTAPTVGGRKWKGWQTEEEGAQVNSPATQARLFPTQSAMKIASNADFRKLLAKKPRTLPAHIVEANPELQAAVLREYKKIVETYQAAKTDFRKNIPSGAKMYHAFCLWNIKDDGSLKCRIVFNGRDQDPGLTDSWCPTPSDQSLRLLFTAAGNCDMSVRQYDVESAFLNARLKEKVYCRVPDFVPVMVAGKQAEREECMWVVSKALYGLKEAGAAWYQHLRDILIKARWTPSRLDPCLYFVYSEKTRELRMLLHHVDDILHTYKDIKEVKDLTAVLEKEITLSVSRDVGTFLGMDITKVRGGYHLSQASYTRTLLVRYGYENCRAAATPWVKEVGTGSQDNKLWDSKESYSALVGQIGWLCKTKPMIAAARSRLAQDVVNPTKDSFRRASRVLRYLKGTVDDGLLFAKGSAEQKGWRNYSDTDYADDAEDRKSRTGWLWRLCGCLIDWESKKQPVVALSSTEAEVYGAGTGMKKGLYLIHLAKEVRLDRALGVEKDTPQMLLDNQAAMALAKKSVLAKGLKHIEVRWHFINDEVARGIFALVWTTSEDNQADAFTKPLQKVAFQRHAAKLTQTAR